MINAITKTDLILVLILILISILQFVYFSRQHKFSEVLVYSNNVIVGIYPLNHNIVVNITKHNQISILDGKVRMSFADCRDKRCVEQGWSSSMPIICLPNKVTIEIKNSKHKRSIHILH